MYKHTLNKIAARENTIQEQLDDLDYLYNHRKGLISENLPQWLHAASTSTIAGSIGRAAARGKGAAVGAASMLLANILGNSIASIAGASKKSRTGEEQLDYEERSKWKNWLLPMVASYRKGRTFKFYQQAKEDVRRRKMQDIMPTKY